MKKGTLKAERKIFPSFEFKFSAAAAVKFGIECLAIALMASVNEFGFALALALFCGFVFARQNIAMLAPAFVIACCVFSLNWWTLLFAATPVATLFALYFVFFKLRRNVPLWSVALAALVGYVPYIVVNCALYGAYVHVAVAALILLVGVFVAGAACYAALVRGFAGQLCVDELIAGGVLVAAFGYALSGADFWGFKLVYIAAGAALLICSQCFKAQITLFVALLLGAGAALDAGDMACLAGLAVLGVAAITFSPFTKWASALAMLAAQGGMWLAAAYSGAGWRAVVMTAAGVVAALFVPKDVVARIRALAGADDRTTYTGVVNRQGREMAGRLYSASEVFYELSKSMEKSVDLESVFNAERLAKEVSKNYCGKCPDRDGCFKALGGEDNHAVLKPMAEAALGRGRVTILDMPPFITSRCTKTHTLASVINGCAETYLQKREASEGATLGKRMMSEQFAGMALILDALAEDCARPVSFAGGDAEALKSEMLKHNIVASEAVIWGTGEDMSVSLLVRAQDATKTAIARVASKALGRRLTLARIEDRGSGKLVTLQSAPIYEIAYGVAEKCRSGESECGDSKSILCPSLRRRLFAICDGMGSGEGAAKASRDAVSMIESFYRAGFEGATVLGLINKLLKISLEDSFSSLDIAVIDVSTGALDVIKLGAASSFIVRQGGIEQLSCSQPPAGILDGVQPLTSRYQLYDGDALIMMSDGVYDALEASGVADIVDALDAVNPQRLADALLSEAVKKGSKDDCTVLAMRLFAA